MPADSLRFPRRVNQGRGAALLTGAHLNASHSRGASPHPASGRRREALVGSPPDPGGRRARVDRLSSTPTASSLPSVLQLKQSLEGLEQGVRNAVLRFVTQRFQRRMEQLVDQTVKGLIDLLAGRIREFGQLVVQPT
jgi:hypothetical protein